MLLTHFSLWNLGSQEKIAAYRLIINLHPLTKQYKRQQKDISHADLKELRCIPWHMCDGASSTCFVYLSSVETHAPSRKTKLGFSKRRHSTSWYSCSHFQPLCAPFTATLAKNTYRNFAAARPNFRKPSNECRLNTVGQKNSVSLKKRKGRHHRYIKSRPPQLPSKLLMQEWSHDLPPSLCWCDSDGTNSRLGACDSPLHLFQRLP